MFVPTRSRFWCPICFWVNSNWKCIFWLFICRVVVMLYYGSNGTCIEHFGWLYINEVKYRVKYQKLKEVTASRVFFVQLTEFIIFGQIIFISYTVFITSTIIYSSDSVALELYGSTSFRGKVLRERALEARTVKYFLRVETINNNSKQ